MAFRTFQTPRIYDEALKRHGQWVRWTKVMQCPCVEVHTSQPDPRCRLCSGRGRLYDVPHTFKVYEEDAAADRQGRIFPQFSPLAGDVEVWHRDCRVPVDSISDTFIQLAKPRPPRYSSLRVTYSFSSVRERVAEPAEEVAKFVLRPQFATFEELGKKFVRTTYKVHEVRNITTGEVVTVNRVDRELIHLSPSYVWEGGHEWEVDYSYVDPFDFVVHGITQRMIRDKPYIAEAGEAVLLTPHWAVPAPDDIFTSLAVEQYNSSVIKDTAGDVDELTHLFDVASIRDVVDIHGKHYTPGSDVVLVGRNLVKWNVPKPSAYTIQTMFHPSYRAIEPFSTVRNAENKVFANRMNLKLFSRPHEQVTF